MSSQGIWSSLPMTWWNMLAGCYLSPGKAAILMKTLRRFFFHPPQLPVAPPLVGFAPDHSIRRCAGGGRGGRRVDGPGASDKVLGWRREGRSRAWRAARFPSVMKVEQLIIAECSLLSWPEKTWRGCVCVGGGLRECMNSINVSKSYLSERSRCKCVKQTLLFFYFCLMVSGFDSYTFTQGIKSYYIRSLIPIRSCVNHPAPNEGIKRTRLYSWEYSVILCFPAVLLHLDKSSPSKVYE